MQPKPPVFIVGCPRSGTTWLYHILLSSGGFAIWRAEPAVFTYLGPMFGHFRSRRQRERFLERWLLTEDFFRSGLHEEYVAARILDDCRSTGDCLRILMDGVAARQGADRWSDSTPDNLLVMEQIRQFFPNALFVHMVRDGRDVALSMAAKHWIRPLPWDGHGALLPAALYWSWAVAKGREAGKRLGNGSYLEIHYRDLVERRKVTLARLSDFISHELDSRRICRVAIGSVTRPNTSFTSETGFHPVDRWRSALSRQELRILEWAIAERLQELGYDPATAPHERIASPAARLNRTLYPVNFAARLWLKRRTPLGRWLSNTALLETHDPDNPTDKTLRPGLHVEFIRVCVAGQPLLQDSSLPYSFACDSRPG